MLLKRKNGKRLGALLKLLNPSMHLASRPRICLFSTPYSFAMLPVVYRVVKAVLLAPGRQLLSFQGTQVLAAGNMLS